MCLNGISYLQNQFFIYLNQQNKIWVYFCHHTQYSENKLKKQIKSDGWIFK